MENKISSFLADAITKIQQLSTDAAHPDVLDVNGHTLLCQAGSGPIEFGKALPAAPEPLRLRSLDALVTLIRTEGVELASGLPLYVSCESFNSVRVFCQPDKDREMRRDTLYIAQAADVPGFGNSKWSFEEAMIGLRSQFQQGEFIGGYAANDAGYIIDLLSHMSVDQSVQSDDNGVTQTVQVRKGVSFVQDQVVKPIVTLAPYRTFQEVPQPAGEFVLRVYDDRSIRLTEADGGMWKLAARQAVKDYLTGQLAEEIAAHSVCVTL